jgi:tRNA (adenine37-N6)-methyltransferase
VIGCNLHLRAFFEYDEPLDPPSDLPVERVAMVRRWTEVVGVEQVEGTLRRENMKECAGESLEMNPIGFVRCGYSDTSQIPKGCGAKHDAEGILEVLPQYEQGLKDIEGFSHLYVIWAFDRADGCDLLVKPPTDDRPHGVFATRAPRRPNSIGLTVVKLLGRDGCRLQVAGVDMLDGTPILDLKPYLSSVPDADLRRGWLAEAEARQRDKAP